MQKVSCSLDSKIEDLCRELSIKESELNPDVSGVLGAEISNVYLTLHDIVSFFLKDLHPDVLSKKFAIDIRELVQRYGINIIERKIQINRNFFFYKQVGGYLDIFDYTIGEFEIAIHVDETLDEFSKRYVIAHEFSHCILEYLHNKACNDDLKRTVKICLNTLFPREKEGYICDIMTAFFLMPIDSVIQLMLQFIEKREIAKTGPAYVHEWLKFLSDRMQVPNYHVNICFQHIRYLGSFLYNEGKSNRLGEMIKTTDKLFY